MTDWEALARPSLQGLERYDPGPSRDQMKERHGLAELEPLNWNEDLFGPPAEALEAAAAELGKVAYYPERAYADFRDAVAAHMGLPAASIIPAHGVQSLIGTIATAFVDAGTTVVTPTPTYGLYAQVSAAAGAEVVRVPGRGLDIDLDAVAEAARSHGARVVWLSDPNNPTGGVVSPGDWAQFLDRLPPACAVIADEAYMDFADPAVRADRIRDVVDGRPVIMLRSFSKTYGLAGLRLGFAIADPEVARLLDIVQEPFNVNRVALAAGRAAVASARLRGDAPGGGGGGARAAARAADRARAVHASLAGQLPAGQPGHGRRPGLRAAAARGRADPRWNRVRAARDSPGSPWRGSRSCGAPPSWWGRPSRQPVEVCHATVYQSCWSPTGSPNCSSDRAPSTWSASRRTA